MREPERDGEFFILLNDLAQIVSGEPKFTRDPKVSATGAALNIITFYL
jgi:hypothetical protein